MRWPCPDAVPEDYEVPSALSVWVSIQEEVRRHACDTTGPSAALTMRRLHASPCSYKVETLLQDYLQDPLAQSAADAERAAMEEARSAPAGALLRPGASRKESSKVRAAFTASLAQYGADCRARACFCVRSAQLFAFSNTEAAINMAIYYRDRRRERDGWGPRPLMDGVRSLQSTSG